MGRSTGRGTVDASPSSPGTSRRLRAFCGVPKRTSAITTRVGGAAPLDAISIEAAGLRLLVERAEHSGFAGSTKRSSGRGPRRGASCVARGPNESVTTAARFTPAGSSSQMSTRSYTSTLLSSFVQPASPTPPASPACRTSPVVEVDALEPSRSGRRDCRRDVCTRASCPSSNHVDVLAAGRQLRAGTRSFGRCACACRSQRRSTYDVGAALAPHLLDGVRHVGHEQRRPPVVADRRVRHRVVREPHAAFARRCDRRLVRAVAVARRPRRAAAAAGACPASATGRRPPCRRASRPEWSRAAAARRRTAIALPSREKLSPRSLTRRPSPGPSAAATAAPSRAEAAPPSTARAPAPRTCTSLSLTKAACRSARSNVRRAVVAACH